MGIHAINYEESRKKLTRIFVVDHSNCSKTVHNKIYTTMHMIISYDGMNYSQQIVSKSGRNGITTFIKINM